MGRNPIAHAEILTNVGDPQTYAAAHAVVAAVLRPFKKYKRNCKIWRSREARCHKKAEPTDAENRCAKHFARNRNCGVPGATTDYRFLQSFGGLIIV